MINVKSKSRVKWKSSKKTIVTVKSLSKTKAKITAKNVGTATVTGKSGKKKWIIKVSVKKTNSTKKSDFIFNGIYTNNLAEDNWIHFNGAISGECFHNYYVIAITSTNKYKKVTFKNLTPDVIKIDKVRYAKRHRYYDGMNIADCEFHVLKAGKAAIQISHSLHLIL